MKTVYKISMMCLLAVFLGSCASQTGGTASADKDKPAKDYSSYTNMADVLRSVGGIQVSGYGQNVTVTLRGVNTFTGDTQPLYVVNKIPMGTDYGLINQIAPQDIDDIRVLKGTYAINRYGNLGRNGAILITTEK